MACVQKWLDEWRSVIRWEPIYFDSLGAKCSSILVETPDVRVLIDPGAAEMHPGYPMSWDDKMRHLMKARRAIEVAAIKADIIIISHYHYDHHGLLDTPGINAEGIYRGKRIYAKDPNQYTNESQWARARLLWSQILERFGGKNLGDVLKKPKVRDYPDPMESLPISAGRDWGDYAERKKALIEKGRMWFGRLVNDYWSKRHWVPEFRLGDIEVFWGDGRRIRVGKTEIIFSEPRFHGLEFDRVGWVFSTLIQHEGEKILHTSDLEGVQVDDYRETIIRDDPDILIIDGPATYLFGYLLNRINLNRSVENLCKIVKESRARLIILDHHLLRDERYRERLKKVYAIAKRGGKRVITVAEYLGMKPKILELTEQGKPTFT